MLWTILVTCFIYFGSVRMDKCNNEIVLDEILPGTDAMCKGNRCLWKCCGKNEYVTLEYDIAQCETFYNDNSSAESVCENPFNNMLNVELYDDYKHDRKSDKKLSDVFLLNPGKFSEIIDEDENITFADIAFVGTDIGIEAYLSEGGILYMEFPNTYARWMPIQNAVFCVDIDNEFNPKFWVVMNSNKQPNNEFHTIGLIISTVFLTIVFLVYLALPELRNLAGLVLMAYVFSLAIAFTSLACLQKITFSSKNCIVMTGITYFFFLSTFCWMSVMSYDIWWTFRGYAKARTINRRGEHFKFGMYCLYAWGVPTIMTIGLIEVDKMDLSQTPWIIKPQVPKYGCFLEDGQKLVYLYIPMLILIVCNWIFYLMTAFNIWRLVRGTTILGSAHRSQKNRLMVYLKLSVIMGINWLLEVVSFLYPDLTIWKYTDAYNLLIGFSIFLIFVWKQKIYRKLRTRFTSNPLVHKFYHNSVSSTLESSLGQETSSICTNPKGSEAKEKIYF